MNKLRSILLVLTSVAALSLAYPASVQADTTYVYTGNPFTVVSGSYTTSMFVTAMITLASPLAANMGLTQVFPTAFSMSDGVRTITDSNAESSAFLFTTGPTGSIVAWNIGANDINGLIRSNGSNNGSQDGALYLEGQGVVSFRPGTWTIEIPTVPDTGSTASLMTLTLMALGVAARQFKRAAA